MTNKDFISKLKDMAELAQTREAKILMNILLTIYFVICGLLTLFGLVWNDSGIPFETFMFIFLSSLLIYTIIHLLYDTYKQFASWKIVNIILLLFFLYVIMK